MKKEEFDSSKILFTTILIKQLGALTILVDLL
jgi:hypothetical protein